MKALIAAAVAMLCLSGQASAVGTNMLTNGDFEGGNNGPTDYPYSNTHYLSYSSAPYWGLYNDHSYTNMSTEILGNGVGESGDSFIHVLAGAQYSGIVQSTNGSPFDYLSADINVIDGRYVLLQAVSGNDVTWSQSVDTSISGWQHVVLDLSIVPYSKTATQLRVVSGDYSGDSFYVDNVYAGIGAPAAAPVPEPGEWAMMGAGLIVAGAVGRRRRKG